MELLTDEIKNRFQKYPLYSQEGKGLDAKVIAKFINPFGSGTWLITEGSLTDDNDYIMFGYCHLGNDEDAELGYVLLSELEDIHIPVKSQGQMLGYIDIERDDNLPENCTLKKAMKKSGLKIPPYLLEQEKEKNRIPDEKLMKLLDENGYYLTDNIKESIYILRNGKMISGNFDCGIRGVEHREIAELFIEDEDRYSPTIWSDLHDRTGVVMVVPEKMELLIMEGQELTEEQIETINDPSNPYSEIEEYCKKPNSFEEPEEDEGLEI